jgi:hypothetical protein
MNFGVRLSGFVVPTLSDDAPVVNNHTAHKWVWVGAAQSFFGQLDTTRHKFFM